MFLVASFSCFRFPLLLCFAAFFSHELEGADPSSYAAYPQAIAPALRPSEGQGGGIVLGRLDTAFRDTFFAFLCLAEGHRDPSGLFLWGGGAFSAPSGPFSHALVFCFPAPGFFFLFFSLSCWPLNGMHFDFVFHEWSDTFRALFRENPGTLRDTPSPTFVLGFLYGLGGNAVRFFHFVFFLCLVRCLLSFFTVLLFLGSLFGKIFGSELLFLSVVVGLVFFDSVLPRFLFYFLVFAPENVSEKFS